jgi:hypothetical protein
MKDVRDPADFDLDIPEGFIDELVKMRPEKFLADIAPATALDPDYPGLFGKGFDLPAIIFGNFFVIDDPGHQINPVNPGLFSETPGQFQNIFHLTAGIGITTKFGSLSPDQPMNTEQLYVKT